MSQPLQPMPDLTDAELLALSLSEPEAFGVIYQRHERMVFGYFMRHTRDVEVSADLTAETFAVEATSRELESTQLSVDRIRDELAIGGREVDEIRRELIIDGREVYALEGPGSRCILIAGIGQPAGKSESIGCQPSNETKPLGTSFALRSGKGTVHLVWTGPSLQAVSAQAGGRRLATRSGPTILAVSRPDPDAAGTVTWTAAGQPKSVNLISARELDPRRRAANASAAPASR